ncbi:MAG TPA: hypothetical protein VGI65_05950 [Steroidobacteraceae bacterium]
MSAISIPSSTAAATLPAANIHPHGHGHKKGGIETDPLTDDSSSTTAAQVPVGAAKNLFSNLLNSLEQVIGVTPAGSLASSAANLVSSVAGSGTGSGTAAASSSAAGSKINVMA